MLVYFFLPSTKQSGLTAVVRSLSARLAETVSLRDMGAAGDGIADDSAALNAANDLGFAPGALLRCTSAVLIVADSNLETEGLRIDAHNQTVARSLFYCKSRIHYLAKSEVKNIRGTGAGAYLQNLKNFSLDRLTCHTDLERFVRVEGAADGSIKSMVCTSSNITTDKPLIDVNNSRNLELHCNFNTEHNVSSQVMYLKNSSAIKVRGSILSQMDSGGQVIRIVVFGAKKISVF